MTMRMENYFPCKSSCPFEYKNKKVGENEKSKSKSWEVVRCSALAGSKVKEPYGGGGGGGGGDDTDTGGGADYTDAVAVAGGDVADTDAVAGGGADDYGATRHGRKRRRKWKSTTTTTTEEGEGEGVDPEKVGEEWRKGMCSKRGKKVNIESLLTSSSRDFLVDSSGNKVKVSSLEGKYIFIKEFGLPVMSSSMNGEIAWALKHAIPKWPRLFHLVVVPIIDSDSDSDSDSLLKSFLAGFPPSSCLAIPISDSASIRRVSAFICRDCLILDPNAIILQHSDSSFLRFGAPLFPFTLDRESTLYVSSWRLEAHRPVRLERLLGLRPSHSLSNAAATATTRVSDLTNSLVGLYLCRTGNSLDCILKAYQHCRGDFQVVVVYAPFSDDPTHFISCANAALEDRGISSWWLLPFDDTTSRRLSNLCRLSARDELIVVGPRGEFMDPGAANILTHPSVSLQDTYPYAAEALARQETDRLLQLTLDSLLSCSPHHCLHHVNPHTHTATRRINRRYLHGKLVCVFIAKCDHHDQESDEALQSIAAWCRENPGAHSNAVLVFIPFPFPFPFHSSNNNNNNNYYYSVDDPRMSWLWDPSMSWLICRPDPACQASITKHTTLMGSSSPWHTSFMCLVFRQDGKFISMVPPSLSNIQDSHASFLPDDPLFDQLIDWYFQHFAYDNDSYAY